MRWKLHLSFLSIYLLCILHQCFTNTQGSTSAEDSTENSFVEAARKEYMKYQNDRKQLKINKKKLEDEKINKIMKMTDVIQLNVGGEIMVTTRKTLMSISTSILAKIFQGQWDDRLHHDNDGNIFLDFNPTSFRYLLEQLRQYQNHPSFLFTSPESSSLFAVQSFNRMLKKLDLKPSQLSSNPILVMNVGGNRIITRQKSLNASQSIILKTKSKMTSNKRFLDTDPWLFRYLLGQWREQKISDHLYFHAPSIDKMESMNRMLSNFGLNPITTTTTSTTSTSTTTMTTTTTTTALKPSVSSYLARWQTNGVTVAGGHAAGNGSHQLCNPCGLFVDENQTVYIADHCNHRITAWKTDTEPGEIVAGGNGPGGRLDQLHWPTDVIVDRETDSLLICDHSNSRIMRWSRHFTSSSVHRGEIFINGIACFGLRMDDQSALYVSDHRNHQVRRYDKGGDTKGTIVAGGHDLGAHLNQLNCPTYLFVDTHSTVYVSDTENHRVMKWIRGAKEGVVVAGRNGRGNDVTQLDYPNGVWVDESGNVYVVDQRNNRVMGWKKGAKEGVVVVGSNRVAVLADWVSSPVGLFFDLHGHLYVADCGHNRVQRFSSFIHTNLLNKK